MFVVLGKTVSLYPAVVVVVTAAGSVLYSVVCRPSERPKRVIRSELSPVIELKFKCHCRRRRPCGSRKRKSEREVHCCKLQVRELSGPIQLNEDICHPLDSLTDQWTVDSVSGKAERKGSVCVHSLCVVQTHNAFKRVCKQQWDIG